MLLAICVLGLSIAAFSAWKILKSMDDIQIDTDTAILKNHDVHTDSPLQLTPTTDSTDGEIIEKPEDFYALLIGLDYRTGSYTLNTDTIIVAHVIPQTEKVKLISLPRDLRVDSHSGEVRKINALFYDGYSHARWAASQDASLLSGKEITLGGWTVPEEYFSSGMVNLREHVEDILNINIDYSFLIHFETLIDLVDAIGGIEIDVERSMQYDDPTDNTHIYFEPGLQTLDGQQSLNYARFRQDNRGVAYYSNDFERSIRQQKIISAIADKITSWHSLSRANQILDVVASSIKTDMGKNEMLGFVRKYYDVFNGESLESIPFEGEWQNPYVVISDSDLQEVRESFISLESVQALQPTDDDEISSIEQ